MERSSWKLAITALPMVGVWTTLNMQQIWIMLAIGLVAMLYQLMMTKAYQRGKAYKVASLLYSTVIFAALFDWYMGRKFLDYVSCIGILLILIGSVFSLVKMSKEKKASAEFLDKH
ncbi:MAG: EamA family transporter [Candidatus Algichlamydia australiensis]|nr:EamA family transporter [Chlamydiales bacterium]